MPLTEEADLAVGVAAPLGLSAPEMGSLVRQTLRQITRDFGFHHCRDCAAQASSPIASRPVM